jgi:hypothetical protein
MGTKALRAFLYGAMLAGCVGCAKSGAKPNTAEGRVPAAQSAGVDAQKDDAGEGAAKKGETGEVALTPEQVARLGIVTTAVQEARYSASSEGFGVVVSHELIAQATADLHTATVAAMQSEAALARAQRLSSGPGALGADVLENAQRQTGADQATMQLARRKLTSLLGIGFPWRGTTDGELEKLADGTHELLRVTFPPDSSLTSTPRTLRVSSIDAPSVAWIARTVWAAPHDPTLPGRTVFAVLTDSTLAEGAHVRARSSSESSVPGVVVPEPAVVITDGQYWCYLKRKDGVYQRVAVDGSRPLGDGFFVADGVAAGDEVVTSAAGLLLARELNAGSPSD